MKRLRGRSAAVAAASLLSLAGTTAGALALSAPPGEPGPVPPLSEAGPVQVTEPALLSAFALLRRAQRPDDVIPGSVQVAFSEASGANLARARRVQGEAGGEAWLIPGRGAACILARDAARGLGGAVCTSAEAAAAGQLDVQSASVQVPGSELLAGVVPDGVAAVTLQLAGGATMSVAVHEDVYISLVPGAVTSIGAAGPSGPLSIPSMSASAAVG